MRRRKSWRLTRARADSQDKHILGNGPSFIALIVERISKGVHGNSITNHVKIVFREINIASTHPFSTRKIKNPSEL